MGMRQHEIELLNEYEDDLIRTLNLAYLLPQLTKCKLLTSNEADQLLATGLTREDAIKKFLTTLKTKGETAFSLFIDGLRSEKEHLGHASLYKALTSDPPRVSEPAGSRTKRFVESVRDCLSPGRQLPSLLDIGSSSMHSQSSDKYSEFNEDTRSSSDMSHMSSSTPSSSISSEALSSGLTLVNNQLDSLKDQMSVLTNKFDHHNLQIMSTLTSLSRTNSTNSSTRQSSFHRTSFDGSSVSNYLSQSLNSSSNKQNKKSLRRSRTTTCLVTKKVIYFKCHACML